MDRGKHRPQCRARHGKIVDDEIGYPYPLLEIDRCAFKLMDDRSGVAAKVVVCLRAIEQFGVLNQAEVEGPIAAHRISRRCFKQRQRRASTHNGGAGVDDQADCAKSRLHGGQALHLHLAALERKSARCVIGLERVRLAVAVFVDADGLAKSQVYIRVVESGQQSLKQRGIRGIVAFRNPDEVGSRGRNAPAPLRKRASAVGGVDDERTTGDRQSDLAQH